jgi:hypothetical protein
MEYIKLEQFKSLEEDVQKVFLNWWKPKRYDLYIDSNDLSQVECLDFVHENEEGILYFSMRDNISELEDMVPLLNKGQLGEFIEDKTDKSMEIKISKWKYKEHEPVEISVIDRKHDLFYKEYGGLLQALWKVALEIAKEELSNE